MAEDFDVATAADGITALDTVPLGEIDLVVLDAGASRAASPAIGPIRAREGLAGVPILVVSDPDQDAWSARLLREGAQDRVRMPVSAEELRVRALSLVAIKRARDVLGAAVANLAPLVSDTVCPKKPTEVKVSAAAGLPLVIVSPSSLSNSISTWDMLQRKSMRLDALPTVSVPSSPWPRSTPSW